MSRQLTLFEGALLQMNDSIRLTIESIEVYGAAHDHWCIAWSGGKDSTALVTLVVWLILARKIRAPKTLTVLYADTRLELLPLSLSAQSIREELLDHADALAELGCALDVRTVMAPVDKRFLCYVLGRGVPPPNNNTLRWCTRQIKVDPMRAELARVGAVRGDVLMLTGVRLGESAARDARIALSCSKGDGECGQGWYQRDLVSRGHATLAPLLHWRVCHVWEWLRSWAPRPEHGDWTTTLLAEVYGGDEAEELHARTGCVGCPLAQDDRLLDRLVAMEAWSYLAPLRELRPLWRHLREPAVRLRKGGGEKRQDGTLVANQYRMGPIVLAARAAALEVVLDIQRRINDAAAASGRRPIDLLTAEEERFIRECIALGVWPQKWTGHEPLATEPFGEPGAQLVLFDDFDDAEDA